MIARSSGAVALVIALLAFPPVAYAVDVSNDTTIATGSPTARTLANRAADAINAADYGVQCDGSTNNATTFAAALAAAGAKHVNLIVPAGVCLTSATILNNYSGVTMIGAASANSVDDSGGENFVGTTIKYTGVAGGTVMAIGQVSISGSTWTVDFNNNDILFSQGLVGITLDCGGLAARGLYLANTADILIDARVYQPVNFTSGTTTYYATSMEVDGNVNRGSISLSWYESSATAGTTGINPVNSYPTLFSNGSNSYNYALPAAPYPIGVWFHSSFTYAPRSGGGITGGNPSYISVPKLISSNQGHGVPVQVDWADHLNFGLIDEYGASGTLVGGAGMVINNSNLMWTSGVTSGDTPAGSHTMVLASANLVNPYGQIMLTGGGTALSPTNNCAISGVTYATNTLTICGTTGTSADIPSGTAVMYLRAAAGQSPGGMTIGEYQSGAPLVMEGGTGIGSSPIPPMGLTIHKYDVGNNTPSPVINPNAVADWEDDLSTSHRLMVGPLSPTVPATPPVTLSALNPSVGSVLSLNGAGLALGTSPVTIYTDSNGLNLNGSGLSVGYPIKMFNSGVYELQIYGDTSGNLNLGAAGLDQIGHGNCSILSGTGSPAGVVPAPQCSLYLRSDGGAGSTLYVKESGSGTSGWAAK